jgi:hypothetical protein
MLIEWDPTHKPSFDLAAEKTFGAAARIVELFAEKYDHIEWNSVTLRYFAFWKMSYDTCASHHPLLYVLKSTVCSSQCGYVQVMMCVMICVMTRY